MLRRNEACLKSLRHPRKINGVPRPRHIAVVYLPRPVCATRGR